MVKYATIEGKWSGTTDVVYIPFPRWELSYTVDPVVGPSGGSKPSSYTIRETPGVMSETGLKGEYTSVFPQFSIQVMDYEDPNRIVPTSSGTNIISPPGGIDPNLWQSTIAGLTSSATLDPRPWVEKFYEGNHKYYFIITSRFLNSYTLNIMVPKEYVGQY
jgi:hypothetical protein